MKRLVSIGLAALIIATSAAYLGAPPGRAIERNQKCCDRYRLGALAIEHNYEEPKRTDIEQFLATRGYVRARRWLQDDLYLPRLPAGSMPSSDSPRSPAS